MESINHVIVVLGYKLNQDGSLHGEFITRLEYAAKLASSDPNACLVVTGGKTRSEFESEAKVAQGYLSSRHPALLERLILETEAVSTSEHPRLIRTLLRDKKIFPSKFTFVTSEFHRRRSKMLFSWFWPESQISATWPPNIGQVTYVDRIRESILIGVAYADPRDMWLMPFLKSIFRNA